MIGSPKTAILMRIRSYVFLFAMIGLSACSNKDSCGVSDAIVTVKNVVINNTDYTLIRRVSGFQDKSYFYELYQKSPVFDVCGRTDSKLISVESVDESKGRIAKLVVGKNFIRIVYSERSNRVTDVSDIPVEIE